MSDQLTIYKSCSPKYTNDGVKRMSGLTTFVSFERLIPEIYKAIGKKPNEKLVGMEITSDGIKCRLETEE